MSKFVPEPVPVGIDDALKTYLDRQFQAISIASSDIAFAPPVVQDIPDVEVEGAIVHLKMTGGSPDNGLWVCVYNAQNKLEWKKVFMQNN